MDQATVEAPGQEGAITLEIHICDQRRSYLATFATEDQAIAFIERKSATHAFHTLPEFPIDDQYARLWETLDPTCDHGLREALCMGPDHYSRGF
ncbi:hypothetical protein ACFY05_31920 [Microtetraspora fusca]|uniref:ABM domain-containing protein n=1 Tax=Microtetraspora fusca TaxID=1997 RepID=A0ABW6VGV8_MICFU